MRLKLTITILTVVVLLSIAGIQILAQPLDVSYSEQIDSFIQEEMNRNQLPGLPVGIVEDNEILYLRGFGKADSEHQITPQTSFIIGSMSKSFAALAIMQLVEGGKIELDTPVQHYLPWFQLADPEASAQITIRHLLNQTSGIPNLAGMNELVGTGEKTTEQLVRGLNSYGFANQPGQRFNYSNANFWVAGLVVEKVSGESYGEYIGNHIFKPLEMTSSFTSQTEAKKHGMSEGHHRLFGLPIPVDVPYLHHSIPSGYIISSAEDMAHYLIANMNEGSFKDISILSPEGIAELHRPAVKAVTGDYGLGWLIEYVDGNPTILHHGSTANFHSTMLIEPDTNRGIVVLTNVGLFELWSLGPSKVITEGISRLLRDQPPTSYGLGIGTRYLIADIIIGLLTVLVIISFVMLPWWRRRITNQIPQDSLTFARRVILPIVIDFTWPLIILISFPALSHTPSWSYWLGFEPDFSYWLISIASLTLIKAIIRVIVTYRIIRQIISHMIGLKLIIVALVVEILFVTVFLLVMFVSVNPATFVIGLLMASLLLESITFPIKILGKHSARN
jgi:CubicO group peptidase (beta-lactamase class C family)